jgi:hypothetical protein
MAMGIERKTLRLISAGLGLVLWAHLGCAHQVRIESDPPGADVYIDGEYKGKTPLEWEETTARTDFVPVEVHGGGKAHRFALKREGFAGGPIALGIAGGVGGVGLGVLGLASYFAFYFAGLVIITNGNPEVGVPILMLSMPAYAVGTLLLTLGIHAPFIAVGEYGRISPDSVHVDLATQEVTTEPPNRSVPLLGRAVVKKPRKGKKRPPKARGKAKKKAKGGSDATGQYTAPKNPTSNPSTDGTKPPPEGKIDPTDLYEE